MEQASDQRAALLTVDDELNILKSLKRTLRRCDIDVVTAGSGKEALELMSARDFDIIISDMRMPEMSGAEFLAEAQKQQPASKRILLTGYADIQSTVDAINHGGISHYLSKPWDDGQLVNIVEEAVRVKHLSAQNAALEALTKRQNDELKALNNGLEEKVAQRTADLQQASQDLQVANNNLTASYETMVSLLAATAGLRDKEGHKHNNNKIDLSLSMARLSGVKDSKLTSIEQAAQLHRIGILSLPDTILATPYKNLSHDQRAKFDQHPVYAEATLMGVPELNEASMIIRHQNERWDGTGYPDKKQKSDIPFGSRIITLARDYVDLTAGLYDTKKVESQDALDYLKNKAHRKYDPDLIPILLEAVGQLDADNVSESYDLLDVTRLQPGMVLAQDLKSEEGMMLLRKDQALTDALIRKLANLSRTADANIRIAIKTT